MEEAKWRKYGQADVTKQSKAAWKTFISSVKPDPKSNIFGYITSLVENSSHLLCKSPAYCEKRSLSTDRLTYYARLGPNEDMHLVPPESDILQVPEQPSRAWYEQQFEQSQQVLLCTSFSSLHESVTKHATTFIQVLVSFQGQTQEQQHGQQHSQQHGYDTPINSPRMWLSPSSSLRFSLSPLPSPPQLAGELLKTQIHALLVNLCVINPLAATY